MDNSNVLSLTNSLSCEPLELKPVPVPAFHPVGSLSIEWRDQLQNFGNSTDPEHLSNQVMTLAMIVLELDARLTEVEHGGSDRNRLGD